MLGFWLLVLLVLLLLAVAPAYPYSRSWGYLPAAILALLIIFWVLLIWLGFVALVWPWAATPVVTVPPPD